MADRRYRTQRKGRQTVPIADIGLVQPRDRRLRHEPQSRIEGDIQQLPADFPVVDLWKVLAGTEEGRQDKNQITIFDSVGFALEDYSTLRYVYQQALLRDVGVDIELVPDGDDPKNLFRFVRGGRGRAQMRRVA